MCVEPFYFLWCTLKVVVKSAIDEFFPIDCVDGNCHSLLSWVTEQPMKLETIILNKEHFKSINQLI